MANELDPKVPEKTGTALGRQPLNEAYESALESLGEGTGEGEGETPAEAETEPETAGIVETSNVEEPEHIKWVKSIDGDSDPKTGEILTDRVAKRAFELNKQAQANAQKLNQLTQLLQHPDIAPAVARLINPNSATSTEAKKDEEPKAERSDEQVLEDWVNKRIEQRLQPVLEENRMLYQEYANNQMVQSYAKLKDEFGSDDAGAPLYDSVREQVGQQIAQAAAANGIAPQELWNELIRRGQLYDTLASTARNLLYPKLKERVSSLQSKNIDEKKRTRLGPKGTPATSVKQGKSISTFADAILAAEDEHPEFKQLA